MFEFYRLLIRSPNVPNSLTKIAKLPIFTVQPSFANYVKLLGTLGICCIYCKICNNH